ncbi:hypothetical protein D5086_030708 [Populus alba]|uniref:Uncharacterized protein n=1 Tax=Populus alba TaxID=43335 RepID=A0ACC4AQ79_POPAL
MGEQREGVWRWNIAWCRELFQYESAILESLLQLLSVVQLNKATNGTYGDQDARMADIQKQIESLEDLSEARELLRAFFRLRLAGTKEECCGCLGGEDGDQ